MTEKFFAGMAAKQATRTFYGHIRRNLEEHFGKGCDVAGIGPADADGFKAWIAELGCRLPTGKGANEQRGTESGTV